ncbi:Bug family tripartite tricarboxylate transporter substrate binding protein [Arvimicrobium flavum]|uniref:Bug family tripartite tricarboxylate transporter substrate binding protein n=1 Tax=Arvimicrobium flavum TaxID=3393320 RepID=UPI00237ADEC7|nr:tripartite tricarboxylate transporter substrate binding protein [Mesorhizobium shangrilense]
MKRTLRSLAIACLAAATFAATSARAEYPERPITLIVPFSAGGNSDVIARIVADHMSTELGKPVVVENRGGGGGSVGTAMAAGAKPDGYTLLFATAGTHSVNPNLRDVGYDAVKDFAPISLVVDSSVLIAVNPDVKAATLAEMMALTSKGETQLNFASGGVGTVAHVAGELYNEMTGSKMIHVPYQGAGDALNDVVAGRVQVYLNNFPTFLPHIASGALRPIALAAAERSSLMPDVPTTTEAGLPDLQMGSWFGVVAPKGTPPEAIAKLHAAVVSMKGSEGAKSKMLAIGSEVAVSDTPEAFGALIVEQFDWWGKILDNPAFK